MKHNLIFLRTLQPYGDAGLLLLRVLTGAFLVYGVVDNIVSTERMAEFSRFLAASGFVAPDLMAPISVYFQFVCGILLILGFLTRWSGIALAIHFVIGVVMVHWAQDFRGWWPAIVLVGIGLQFALTGAGRFSIDARFSADAPHDEIP